MTKYLYAVILLFLFLVEGVAQNRPSKKLKLPDISKPSSQWEIVKSESYSLFYPLGSTILSDGNMLEEVNKGVVKAMVFLGEPYTKPINVVLVDDRDIIEQLLGQATDGTALPKKDMVVEVRGVASSCHEKFHLLSLNAWGIPKQYISEGMAVACDGVWWGYSLHELAHYLLKENLLPDMKSIIKNNKSFRGLDSRFSYPMVGSLMQFIDQTYGRDALLRLWKTGNIDKSLGLSAEDLDNAWKNEIKNYPIDHIDYLSKINYRNN